MELQHYVFLMSLFGVPSDPLSGALSDPLFGAPSEPPTFKDTAVGKVCPAGLNHSLGRAIFKFAATTFDSHSLRPGLPNEFDCFSQQVFEAEKIVQPDFHSV